MAKNMMEGRILDKNFESAINDNLEGVQKHVQKNIDGAHTYAREKQSQFEEAVAERPFEFVVGAFVGGLLIGALLSKKG